MRTEDLDNLTSKMVRHMGRCKEEVGVKKVRALLECGYEGYECGLKKYVKRMYVCLYNLIFPMFL